MSGRASSRFHLSAEWQATKRLFRKVTPIEEHICRVCYIEDGRVTASEQIDHIKPVSTHPHLAEELTNLQFICGPHHKAKTARERPDPVIAARPQRRMRGVALDGSLL